MERYLPDSPYLPKMGGIGKADGKEPSERGMSKIQGKGEQSREASLRERKGWGGKQSPCRTGLS